VHIEGTSARSASSLCPQLELSMQRPGHAAGCLGPLWIGLWASEQRVTDLESTRATIERLAKEQPIAPCALTIVERGAPLMSPAARQCGVETARALAGCIGRAAVVVEGEGLWASAIVSLVTHLVLPARISRITIHRTLAPAVDYLAPATQLARAAIEETVAMLRDAC
jgi:hypothetical protein